MLNLILIMSHYAIIFINKLILSSEIYPLINPYFNFSKEIILSNEKYYNSSFKIFHYTDFLNHLLYDYSIIFKKKTNNLLTI